MNTQWNDCEPFFRIFPREPFGFIGGFSVGIYMDLFRPLLFFMTRFFSTNLYEPFSLLENSSYLLFSCYYIVFVTLRIRSDG